MDNPLDGVKDALKPSGGGSEFKLNGRSLFLLALAAFGIFMVYVLFIKQKTNAANTSGLQSIATDAAQTTASTTTSTTTGLPDSQIAALQAEVTANQEKTVTYLSSIANDAAAARADASGARTDASITLNGVNDLLGNHGTSHNLVPPPVKVTTTKILPPPGKFTSGPVLPMTTSTSTTHAYLSSVGLAHQ